MKKGIRRIVWFGIILFLFIEMYISNTRISVTNYIVTNEKIPKEFDGFKIVQISDFHLKKFADNGTDLVQKIVRQSPDIIVMTGDMITYDTREFSPFYSLCWQLKDVCPIYFITGNHEKCLWNDETSILLPKVKEYGIHVLSNQTEAIRIGAGQINLVGFDMPLEHYHNSAIKSKQQPIGKNEMNELLGVVDKSKFNILLAHSPTYFKDYANWGADLTLSGHIHGGVVRIPILGGVLSPDRVFFPEYDAGVYYQGESELIVSRGIGNSNAIPRLFNKAEIVGVTLKSN